MEKFQNKYRIQSTRLQNWDYRWAGAYFITICTQNREHYFGEIVNRKMNLSQVGVIADILWHEILHHTKNVKLGAFVVMPNHIHGVLILTNENVNDNNVNIVNGGDTGDTCDMDDMDDTDDTGNTGDMGDMGDTVEALHATPLRTPTPTPTPMTMTTSTSTSTPAPASQLPSQLSSHSPLQPQLPHKNEQMAKISPKPNSVSTIIRSYKSAVTKHAHRLGFEFQWQTRFHDHIIRDDKSFQNISNYIINNPVKWQDDKFFNAE